MTQQDALWRAVCEQPDEDAPRLLYADHLEDCGEARHATFVRTQVQLARVPEYDALWAECRIRNADAIRGWTFAHTLPPLPPGASWHRFQFRRGFPWLASVTDVSELIRSGSRLIETAPIAALDLNVDSGITAHWKSFTEWPCLAHLTRLEFSLTRLGAAEILALARSPYSTQLRELSFESDAITAEGLQALVESELAPRLKRLELRSAALAPALLTNALTIGPPTLHALSLAECKLPDRDLTHLMMHLPATRISSLDLSFNHPQLEAMALASCRGRTILKLKGVNPNVAGIQSLLLSPTTLRWLDLSDNRLGPRAVRQLAQSLSIPDLRVLDLSNNPIGASGAHSLAESEHLRELVELNVRGCELDPESIELLARRFGPALRTDAIPRPVHRTLA